jgi:subtilisin family serine protease
MVKIKFLFFLIFFVSGTFYSGFFAFGSEDLNEDFEIIIKYKNSDEFKILKIKEKNFDEFYRNNFNENIEYIEPNFKYFASYVPNDPFYKNQWYLEKIGAPRAWEKLDSSSSRKNPVIAIIDSGIKIDHPDLEFNIWENIDEIGDNGIDDDRNGFIDDKNGWDFVANADDPSPKFDPGFTEEGIMHGTIVAGIAAATSNNNKGISGVAQNAKIMPLRVLNDKGEGRTSEVIRAIDYAITNGADIINLSFVGFNYSEALDEAIRRAYRAGIIIIAAAGNEQGEGHGYNLSETPMYPVCHDGVNGENMVIGVASTDAMDQKTDFSSYGFSCVDITAPGVSIFSTTVYDIDDREGNYIFDKYYDGYWSGTSMSVPMISGAIALILEANPNIKRQEAVNILLSTSDNISRLNPEYLGQLGVGRVNLEKAVSLALERNNNQEFKVLTAPSSDKKSELKFFNQDGLEEKTIDVYGQFSGGVNIASGDVNGDGIYEIITGAGPGGGPHVRVFSGTGELRNQFFAYDKNLRSGVNVASGDVNGDGIYEIITSQNQGETSLIKIFSGDGKKIINQFLAYHPSFRGGVNIASGDVNGDGIYEIITGAGPGGGPHVRIFDYLGNVKGQFFAYDKNFRGGVKVMAANVNNLTGRVKAEIITGAGPGGGPHVRIFDYLGNVKGQFFAYDKNFRGGVNVASGDINGDGIYEIITGAGPGGGPHVRIFKDNGNLIDSFYSYEREFKGGVNVGAIRTE